MTLAPFQQFMTAVARQQARATALRADRAMAWDELGLLSKEEREAYWTKFIGRPRPAAPTPALIFDFFRDDTQRDYDCDDGMRRNYENGE